MAVNSNQNSESDVKNKAAAPAGPGTMCAMSGAELDAKLEHSYAQSCAGEGRPLDDVFDDLERKLRR